NKTYINYWPAEYHSQSAIEAAVLVRKQLNGDMSQVKSIDILTFEACYNFIGKYPEAWAPKTRETADHSLPYCTAGALMDGDVYLNTFDEARFTDQALLDLTSKIQVHCGEELSARYPKGIPNRLTI